MAASMSSDADDAILVTGTQDAVTKVKTEPVDEDTRTRIERIMADEKKFLKASKKAFKKVDKNGDKRLDKEEMFEVIAMVSKKFDLPEMIEPDTWDELWDAFDEDGNGVMDLKEFQNFYAAFLQMKLEQSDASDVDSYSSESSNVAGLNDEHISRIRRVLNNEKKFKKLTKRCFKQVDSDGNKVLDKDEVREVVEVMHDALEIPTDDDAFAEHFDEFFSELDEDSDGTISLKEFRPWYRDYLEQMLAKGKGSDEQSYSSESSTST